MKEASGTPGLCGTEPRPPRPGRFAGARPSRLYPFLFGLYPALSLYLRNIREVPPTQALWALLAALVISLAGWFATRLACRCRERRLLLLFLFLLLFHLYGLFYQRVEGLLPRTGTLLAAHALAFIVPGGAWLLLSRGALRIRPQALAALNRFLGIAVICLVGWNLAGVLLHHGQSLLRRESGRSAGRALAAGPSSRLPDIYLIILDEFAAPEAALTLFDHDASPLVDSLRQKGFFVAQGSRAPFRQTERALASYLNLGEGDAGRDPYAMIRRNAAVAFLKQRGYRIIEFPAAPALFLEGVDQRHYYSLTGVSVFFDDYYRALFERSLLRFLPERWARRAPDSARYYRERVRQVFAKLPKVAAGAGPKFVFVHLYSPHEPFVFDARGGPVPSDHFWDHADRRYYRQQYAYVSSRIEETAAAILAVSPRPPVIILQSDHGYRGSLGRKKWLRLVDERDATRVFNALFLPGVRTAALDPALSPLNNLRLVFNAYFGTRLPLLANP
jgi:hypothetical protein